MYLDKEARIEKEKELVHRWEWLTEGIDEYEEKLNTSILLENAYDTMIENRQLSPGWLESTILNESELDEAPVISTSAGSNLIPKVLFPVIRRVFPALIANKLVSVQPIQARTGVIYYIIYTFTNTKGGIAAGDEYSGVPQQGLPGYSTFFTSEKIGPFGDTVGDTVGDSTTDQLVTAGTAVTDFLGTSGTDFSLKRIEVYNDTTKAAYATSMQAMGSGAPSFTDSNNVYYDYSNGVVYLRRADNAASPWSVGDKVVVYVVYNQEASNKLPEMEFTIGSEPVTTTERKLKIRWTKEAEQDIKAYHKIDVESELVKVASMEMNYEIDREIILFIGDQVTSDLSIIHDWTGDSAGNNNTAGNYLDRHRALAQKMYQLAAKVSQYNRIGPANWAVVSPQVGALLNMLPDFKGEVAGGTFTVFEAGKLGGNIKVYVDPNRSGTLASEILLGYKSIDTTYGAGVVYAPYTNWISNLVTDPNNFNSIRGFFSRYALKKVPRGQWHYAKMTLQNYGI